MTRSCMSFSISLFKTNMFVAVVALLTQTACVLLGLLTVSVSASDYCQEHAPAGAVNGCSVPLLHFQYEPQFTPSCNKHDICYHCVSIFNLLLL